MNDIVFVDYIGRMSNDIPDENMSYLIRLLDEYRFNVTIEPEISLDTKMENLFVNICNKSNGQLSE